MTHPGFITLLASAFLFAACSSTPPSRLYLLDARAPRLDPSASAAPRIHLEAVRVPGHLRRPLVLTHKTPNELAFSEFDRWAEDLPENIHRVLRQNLLHLHPGESQSSDSPSPPSEIRISVEILQLTSLHGQAFLEAQAEIDPGDGIPLRIFPRHERPLASESPADVVAAYSQLIADLAADLAAALLKFSPSDPSPKQSSVTNQAHMLQMLPFSNLHPPAP